MLSELGARLRPAPTEGGVKLGKTSWARFTARVRELAGDDALVMSIAVPLQEVLDTMLKQAARLTKTILDIVRQEAICRRLMSVPGVGPITALTFRATIGRPERFGRSRRRRRSSRPDPIMRSPASTAKRSA